ncbi:hypothetical protein K505DRAFT_47443 [Melanomma pulvis-pyrius CBS 109.77]|uniref:Uncharacterized protein n=1 Tax=Melanomma pulvis-pyrius CBS 109.77 TaxID=1314802 RepID=A0A6A6XU91_9PLEO|nr:hypothetical protein K505DRAFT_47443 [Melanomma pulvis-pyrius CBS 109.77]
MLSHTRSNPLQQAAEQSIRKQLQCLCATWTAVSCGSWLCLCTKPHPSVPIATNSLVRPQQHVRREGSRAANSTHDIAGAGSMKALPQRRAAIRLRTYHIGGGDRTATSSWAGPVSSRIVWACPIWRHLHQAPRRGLLRIVPVVSPAPPPAPPPAPRVSVAHEHRRMEDGVRYRSPDQTLEPHPEHQAGHGQLPQSCNRAGPHEEA